MLSGIVIGILLILAVEGAIICGWVLDYRKHLGKQHMKHDK